MQHEDTSNAAATQETAVAQQPQTPEQQTQAMLKEVLRNIRWIRRMHLTSLIITIAVVVLPIIAAIVVLPRFVTSLIELSQKIS